MEISIHHKTFPTKTDIFLKGNALVATHLQNIRLKSLSDCDSPCFSYGQITVIGNDAGALKYDGSSDVQRDAIVRIN